MPARGKFQHEKDGEPLVSPRAPGSISDSDATSLSRRFRGFAQGVSFLQAPTEYFESQRRRHGDTFEMQVFGYRMLCVLSAAGVKNLWALPEASASKGLADLDLLAHKVPQEIFHDRRTFPHTLFGRDDVGAYLNNVNRAVEDEISSLGDSGNIEIFALTRRLSHRVGLASWGGIEGSNVRYLPAITAALDELDSSESFVHPHRALLSIISGQRREKMALARLDSLFQKVVANREKETRDTTGLFDRICNAWDDAPSPKREIGIGRDVVLIHMGSQSNLFAATAWLLIHLLDRPKLIERIRNGDRDLLERCAHESIRLRQRSIVLRKVLKTVELNDGQTTYRVRRGAYLATMMSATNCSAAPGLEHFDPSNYRGARFLRNGELEARELVTTFGHGLHSCPAQGFSIASMSTFVAALLNHFDFQPLYVQPQPLRRQLGGIARADRACPARYHRRK